MGQACEVSRKGSLVPSRIRGKQKLSLNPMLAARKQWFAAANPLQMIRQPVGFSRSSPSAAAGAPCNPRTHNRARTLRLCRA